MLHKHDIKNQLRRFTVAVSAIAFVMMICAVPSQALSLSMGFELATNTANMDSDLVDDVEAQLLVTLTDNANGTVTFEFTNNVGVSSSIMQIYFSDTLADNEANEGVGILDWTDTISIGESSGVDFDPDANPANLPGNHLPDFIWSAEGSNANNGVNAAGEYVSFTVSYGSGGFIDLAAALGFLDLQDPTFFIGLHVQQLPGYDETGAYFEDIASDAFINTPPYDPNDPNDPNNPNDPPVPEPATLGLMGIGVAALALRRKKIMF